MLQLVSWEEGGYKISDKPMPRGEIVVGGFCVTRGYFNNKEKTDEVYKVNFCLCTTRFCLHVMCIPFGCMLKFEHQRFDLIV